MRLVEGGDVRPQLGPATVMGTLYGFPLGGASATWRIFRMPGGVFPRIRVLRLYEKGTSGGCSLLWHL
jgi:hypothetical protein